MRTGMNPNRQLTVKGYAPIVLSVITHLPNLDDYHEQRLNVIKACLETMRINAGEHDFQVLVWDNGSCDKLLYWLKRSYQPDYLITAPNVGKSIARASIVRMLPPDTMVGVSDDDMFFYPGWLDAHLKIYHTFPRVATVSGWPVRTQFRFANKATLNWGRQHASKFETGRFITEQEERDFCTSIGRDYDGYHKGYTIRDVDTRLTFRDAQAYAVGHHCQWIGRAGTIAEFVQYTPLAMPDERPFENGIDAAGLLRLTTIERTTRHIGNVLDADLEALWQKTR